MMTKKPCEMVYVQKVLQYRCGRCSKVVFMEYEEMELSEERRTEMLMKSIEAHNWIEHGEGR